MLNVESACLPIEAVSSEALTVRAVFVLGNAHERSVSALPYFTLLCKVDCC
jgi:hypothetical protein